MKRACHLFTLLVYLILPSAAMAQVIIGPGPGGDPQVLVIDSGGTRTVPIFGPAFLGGASVTLGDVNGDGTMDIIAGAGPGGGPHVRVLSGVDLTELASFYAYPLEFPGGVRVAAGDINGDGRADIITGAGPSGGPHVRVFSGADLTELASFYAYDPAFPGGVSVAAGDINGDGRADIITGAGPSGGPHVRAFSGVDLSELASFYAYDLAFPGGVSVAAGDINGDGLADIITGAGPSGGPHVRVFSGDDLTELASFYAYDPAFGGGVNVAVGDIDGDGRVDLILGAGPGGDGLVRILSGVDFSELDSFFAPPAMGSGISVGSVGDLPGLRFTSAVTTTFMVGAPGTFTVTTVGNPTPTITSTGALPADVTFVDNGDGTATLAGTPAAGTGGTYALTFTASNGVGASAVQTFTLSVSGAPAFTSAAATTFPINAPGTFAVTTTGFPIPTITLGGAALPSGIMWVDNGDGTGTLDGTAAAGTGGTYVLTFTANNGIGAPAVQTFTLTVNGAPAFTSANAAAFTLNTGGTTFQVVMTGSPAPTVSVTAGVLPTGLTLSSAGLLSGTPTQSGSFPVTLTATNGTLPNATQAFTVVVNAAPAITSANATTFTVGSAGSFNVVMTGFPAPTVSVTAGTLPAGVTLSPAGVLSGTPDPGTGGVHNVTFTATNGIGANAVQAFTLTINEPPIITSANTATFALNTAGTFQVVMTGIPAPTVSVTAGVLPTGLTLSSAGLLSGTPTQSGSFPVTLTATNGTLPNATQSFTVVVNAPPAITSGNTDTFTVGTADSFTVTTTGLPAPTVSQTGALPAGVMFTAATRVLGGTPTQTGVFPLVFTATNGTPPDATQNFTLNVVCPAITVTPLVMPDGLYQTVYAGVDFNQTGSTGSTFTWSATGLPAGLTIDANTGVVSGTATNTVAAGGVVVTVTDNFGCQGSRTTALTVRPTTDNENYLGGVGHTQYATGAPFPATPHVAFVDNVKTGDNGPGALTVTFPATSTNGSIVEGTTDGTFIYTPNLNFGGPSDTFTYTLTDGNGVTNTGTVTINLSNIVWYVNSSAGAGDGRSHSPFNTLNAAATPSGSTHIIYVHSGGATTPGTLAMDANQALQGQGATFTLNGLTIPAGTRPTLTGTVTLADNTTVRAVNFTPSGIAAMAASGVSFAQPVTIDQVNVTGGTSALSLTNVTATATGAINVSNAVFSNTTAAEVQISQGTIPVTLAATATISSNAGRSIDIQNRTGGTVTFNGAITDTGQGVFLNANTGSTINFTGGLALSTTTNPGFTATNGGTVSATQNNTTIVNTITTTTGTALNVANTTIGASGLAFRSISAGTGVSGPLNGIVLSNTGANAGLTVTGNGGSCTSAATCTGGAIQTTTGDGVALTSTRTVSLTRIFVGTAANQGINASAVNGLTLSASRVQDSGNGDNEHGLNLVNVTGTVAIDATTFSGASEDLIHLENNNTNVTLNVTNNSQFSYPASIGGFANSAILLLPGGTAAVTASIQNSTFTNIRGVAAQIGANLLNSSGTQNFTFSNNTINVTIPGRASGVVVGGQELTTTNITIANNSFTGAGGNGVISIDTNDTSRVQGTVSGNQITNPPGIGMFVAVDEAATNDIVLDNNTITNSGGDGIQAVNFGGVGVSTMQLALTNNLINGHSAALAQAFVGGISFTGFEDTSCVVLRGNTVTGTPVVPTQCGGTLCVDYYLEEVGGTTALEEVPNTVSTIANAAYVNAINDAGLVTVFGVIDLTNGATCNVALMAEGGERPARRTASTVDQEDLARLVRAAARRLDAATANGGDRADIAADTVASLGLRLTDLAEGQLGRVAGGHLSLDRHAAGWGWFVDPTPDQDEEYEPASPETGERRARAGGPADGRMDLLTALMHEMGHRRGEIDVDAVSHAGELMAAKLKPGVRRRPPAGPDRRNDGGAFPE